MNRASFSEQLAYNPDKVTTSVILETDFSKEIRILLKKNQSMKAHQTPYPIIVHLLEGEISFGVEGVSHLLKTGDILTLGPTIKHDLYAHEDSIVRLTLSKLDSAARVENVINE